MIIKHRPSSKFPDTREIEDDATRNVFKDLADLIFKAFRNIYDDIVYVERVETGDSLPTASSDIRGKMFLVNGTGAGADTLMICIDTGSSGYGFKTIALT